MGTAGQAGRPSEKEWTLRVYIQEDGRDTTARAVLDTGEAVLESRAEAHCNPRDRAVPAIGDELAVGRALADLGHRLIHTAAIDVETSTSAGAKGENPGPKGGW